MAIALRRSILWFKLEANQFDPDSILEARRLLDNWQRPWLILI
jgi:hypothetical protein